MLKQYALEVTYQPLNKCWGVLLKKGNVNQNVVNEDLSAALSEMAEIIKKLESK